MYNYYLPNEFSVTKEFGLNNKVNYNIEPKAVFENYSNQKTILANIYYTFTCIRLWWGGLFAAYWNNWTCCRASTKDYNIY